MPFVRRPALNDVPPVTCIDVARAEGVVIT